MMLLSGLEMHVEMMVHRSVPAHTASRAAARAKTARLSSIGIMTLKELETAGGTPSPSLTLSFSTPEILMKSETESRAMIIAENRPLVPVLAVERAPVTSAEVILSVSSGLVAASVAVICCGIMMTKAEIATTMQASGLSKRLFLARL